jgi:hypothetical protein
MNRLAALMPEMLDVWPTQIESMESSRDMILRMYRPRRHAGPGHGHAGQPVRDG